MPQVRLNTAVTHHGTLQKAGRPFEVTAAEAADYEKRGLVVDAANTPEPTGTLEPLRHEEPPDHLPTDERPAPRPARARTAALTPGKRATRR